MSRFTCSLLSVVTTLTALAAGAAAQPGAPPAAPAQTHSWSEVSHINGQLVKVGESNDYLYSFRKTIVSTNPVGLIIGFYGISVTHALSDHIAIRGDANYIDPVGEDGGGMWEVGLGVPLYLKRTYQGFFVEPGVIARGEEESDWDSGRRYTDTTAGPQVLLGWHFTWDSGFNVAAAAGAGRNLSTGSDSEYDYDDELFFNGYFRVGYAF